jgi:zinc protease
MAREQSHLVVGFPGAMLNGVDRYAIDVLVEMLGGHGGRLFSSIREEQSLAYDVSGLSFDGLEPGFVAFYAGTSPGNERAVVDAILRDIRRIQQTPPAADELQRVIRYLTGSRAIANQRFSARAADMSLGYLYGLGPDAATVYVNEISRVTAARVVEVARTYLCSDHMVISCAGPRAGRLRFEW